ncbi:MAG: hypothetical protein M1827_007167 [Pycnora praestabilis]|nr:MAG: hypothetical protein M1827_007167 [Pycnora praestabilis]
MSTPPPLSGIPTISVRPCVRMVTLRDQQILSSVPHLRKRSDFVVLHSSELTAQTQFLLTAYVYDNVFDQKSLTTEDINSWYYAAYPIQIRWKSGDFDSTTAATATSSTSSLISPASSASSLSPTASAGSSTHTLSTGVVAAVAVIVAILVIAGSAVMVWWIRKRSKKQAAKRIATENQRANEMQQNQFYKDSHPLNEVPGDTRYNHELEASERAELESQSMNGVAELN